jgi:hypothetical protein
VGTLRFDLNTLASTKEKEAKKAALVARKDFLAAVRARVEGGPRVSERARALVCRSWFVCAYACARECVR